MTSQTPRPTTTQSAELISLANISTITEFARKAAEQEPITESLKRSIQNTAETLVIPKSDEKIPLWSVNKIQACREIPSRSRIHKYLQGLENNPQRLSDIHHLRTMAVTFGMCLESDDGKTNAVKELITKTLASETPFRFTVELGQETEINLGYLHDGGVETEVDKAAGPDPQLAELEKAITGSTTEVKDFPKITTALATIKDDHAYRLCVALILGEFFRAGLGKDESKIKTRQGKTGQKLRSILSIDVPANTEAFVLRGRDASTFITGSSGCLKFLAAILGTIPLVRKDTKDHTWDEAFGIEQASLGKALEFYRMAPVKLVLSINGVMPKTSSWIDYLAVRTTTNGILGWFAYWTLYDPNNESRLLYDGLRLETYAPFMRCFNESWLGQLSNAQCGELNFLLKALCTILLPDQGTIEGLRMQPPPLGTMHSHITMINHLVKLASENMASSAIKNPIEDQLRTSGFTEFKEADWKRLYAQCQESMRLASGAGVSFNAPEPAEPPAGPSTSVKQNWSDFD